MKRRKSGELISVWVGRWLIKNGYVLASCIGRVCTESSLATSDSIGLLMPHQNNPKSRRRLFVGVLWFNNYARGASDKEKEWVFEVYGKEYFEPFQALARKLWSTFYIGIDTQLVKNQPETEVFLSDFDLLLQGETRH